MEEGYTAVDVIVEGALDESETFSMDVAGQKALESFIDRIEAAAKNDGLATEVYITDHAHVLDEQECACVQYLTDLRPDYSWNVHE